MADEKELSALEIQQQYLQGIDKVLSVIKDYGMSVRELDIREAERHVILLNQVSEEGPIIKKLNSMDTSMKHLEALPKIADLLPILSKSLYILAAVVGGIAVAGFLGAVLLLVINRIDDSHIKVLEIGKDGGKIERYEPK